MRKAAKVQLKNNKKQLEQEIHLIRAPHVEDPTEERVRVAGASRATHRILVFDVRNTAVKSTDVKRDECTQPRRCSWRTTESSIVIQERYENMPFAVFPYKPWLALCVELTSPSS